eukprot:CAMPEP_0175455252 /NCGR_PEP_ID=MMETSP0095-20121207/64918_1 /TAXON_ID=311494 /ORGANISM="Alexandrium monilatum, Strain CCMP3105" /LENGTH=231 /DNA_ID=CAMNT_0016756007 /DNA_START=131 /DNA_END=823 /DNA_ORIENTATION=+
MGRSGRRQAGRLQKLRRVEGGVALWIVVQLILTTGLRHRARRPGLQAGHGLARLRYAPLPRHGVLTPEAVAGGTNAAVRIEADALFLVRGIGQAADGPRASVQLRTLRGHDALRHRWQLAPTPCKLVYAEEEVNLSQSVVVHHEHLLHSSRAHLVARAAACPERGAHSGPAVTAEASAGFLHLSGPLPERRPLVHQRLVLDLMSVTEPARGMARGGLAHGGPARGWALGLE